MDEHIIPSPMNITSAPPSLLNQTNLVTRPPGGSLDDHLDLHDLFSSSALA